MLAEGNEGPGNGSAQSARTWEEPGQTAIHIVARFPRQVLVPYAIRPAIYRSSGNRGGCPRLLVRQDRIPAMRRHVKGHDAEAVTPTS